jgi:hypothetical protein
MTIRPLLAELHGSGADALGRPRVAILDAPTVQLYAADGRYEHETVGHRHHRQRSGVVRGATRWV